MARARLIVDLDAVVANWRALDALSAPSVETAAAVKADGYGLGAAATGRALADAGVRSFFVALAEEGAGLRAALGSGASIYVLSGLMPGDADLVRRHRLIPALTSLPQVDAFLRALHDRPFALQLDTGMSRLGLGAADVDRLPTAMPPPALVMSHLACADTASHPMNASQARRFAALAARWPGSRRSLSATGGILLGAGWHHQMTRPGIGLFGGLPFAAARPVVTLSLPVIQVRDLATGDSVGYGADWTASRPTRIATVGAGYGDGLVRALGRGGHLRAGPRSVPIVGRISMDLITADVTDLGEIPMYLEILDESQTIDDLGRTLGTIGYEILTGLGGRYERVYKGPAPVPDPA